MIAAHRIAQLIGMQYGQYCSDAIPDPCIFYVLRAPSMPPIDANVREVGPGWQKPAGAYLLMPRASRFETGACRREPEPKHHHAHHRRARVRHGGTQLPALSRAA